MTKTKRKKQSVITKDVIIYGIYNTVNGLINVDLSREKIEDELDLESDSEEGETYLVEMPITLFLDSVSP